MVLFRDTGSASLVFTPAPYKSYFLALGYTPGCELGALRHRVYVLFSTAASQKIGILIAELRSPRGILILPISFAVPFD